MLIMYVAGTLYCDRNYVVENIRILRALGIIGVSLSSIVDKVTSLWAGRSEVQIRDFSIFLNVQTGSGAHPACSEMGIIVLSLGCDVDYLAASSAKDKNQWRYNCTLPYMILWHGRRKLYLYLTKIDSLSGLV